jgi:hypothetical protein
LNISDDIEALHVHCERSTVSLLHDWETLWQSLPAGTTGPGRDSK